MVVDLSNITDLGSQQLLAVLAIADYDSLIADAAFSKTSQPALDPRGRRHLDADPLGSGGRDQYVSSNNK
jgi:hypothetical protein